MKDDIRRVNSIARKHHMTSVQRWESGDYIHELKQRGIRGTAKRGDFTYHELDELAKEFLGNDDQDEEI